MTYIDAKYLSASHDRVWAKSDTGEEVTAWAGSPEEKEIFASGVSVANYVAPTPPTPDYREQRAARYVADLSDGRPTFAEAVGDVIDALVKEVVSLRVAAGGTADPDFSDKLAKIAAIKSDIPKPE